ncbi:hypothetical protein [Olleya sp. HaHaR_3_96]|uniref:hypothetical protein n=1 Tax=Olleya sp. HaHaR_3_96 TaxID=2745560 RepID=UPI001C4E7E10|nr:hypothetical protein [Olleya sp. HaHaR_3_96]QXP61559.1 hypothetical protein H0I26_07995 [Olleya sp. HaHaR_3_96]
MKEYKNLNEHQGTENYEMITIFDKKLLLDEILVDKKQQLISIISLSKEEEDYTRIKVDFFAGIKGTQPSYNTLKDGTMWSSKSYNNWFINGDDTKHEYIDPLTNEEKKDWKRYNKKFTELYSNASYVYEHYTGYYFKIKTLWYKIKEDPLKFEDCPENFIEQYPAKEDQDIRMVKVKDVFDELRKTNQLKIIDYIEQDSEDGKGLNPVDFSAGYYMLELHLAQGDILKFKRYGGMGTEMEIYQIPKELGGSEEVFFIVQDPNPMYPKKSFGGMYAIRPKSYKKLPEYEATLKKETDDNIKKRRSFLND